MSHRMALSIVVAWTLMIQVSPSEPVRSLDVRRLVASADLIVVGQIAQLSFGQKDVITANGRDMNVNRLSAVLRVDEVIKGWTDEKLIRFESYVPESPSSLIRSVPKDQYGIFFLRRTNASIVVADFTTPYLLAIQGSHVRADAVDSVTVALGEVLLSPVLPTQERLKPPAPLPVCVGNSTLQEHWGQDLRVGSLTPGEGVRVQSDTLSRFTNHAEHQNIVSPSP